MAEKSMSISVKKETLDLNEENTIQETIENKIVLENPGKNYDFELSEEFLLAILKQVDELCENIKNGDSNFERTSEVNQNLNNSVICYKEKLLEIAESKSDLNFDFDLINAEDQFEYEDKPKFENINTDHNFST